MTDFDYGLIMILACYAVFAYCAAVHDMVEQAKFDEDNI